MSNYNEFDDPPRNGLGFLGNVGPKAAFFIVLIALSFMIGVVWKLYTGGGSNTGQDVPIVRADDNPFKVQPDEPGGMEIPHKDSTIFSSLNNDSDSRVENLLADEDEEEPMPRSQLFAGLNTEEVPTDSSSQIDGDLDIIAEGDDAVTEDQERLTQMTQEAENIVEGVIDEGVESVMPPPPAAIREGEVTDATTEAVMKIEEAPAKVEVAPKLAPAPVKVEAPKPTPAPAPAVKATTNTSSGDYYVQLGSVKSAAGAEGEWKKIVGKYPSLLSGYDHRVETADLGDKGTFYRIQAGPVSKGKAVSTCEAIKKINPNGCLLKKK